MKIIYPKLQWVEHSDGRHVALTDEFELSVAQFHGESWCAAMFQLEGENKFTLHESWNNASAEQAKAAIDAQMKLHIQHAVERASLTLERYTAKEAT